MVHINGIDEGPIHIKDDGPDRVEGSVLKDEHRSGSYLKWDMVFHDVHYTGKKGQKKEGMGKAFLGTFNPRIRYCITLEELIELERLWKIRLHVRGFTDEYHEEKGVLY